VADSVVLRVLRKRGAELGRHAALPALDEALHRKGSER
jgi:hypothetical protein